MPELPEVETIARMLREGSQALPGRVVAGAQVLWARSLAAPGAEEFAARIAGQAVRSVGRRAKFLVIELERDYLLVHLRMSGDLRVEAQSLPLQKHDRVVIHFTDGARLAFHDPRKFGRMWLAADPAGVLGALGPEPFDPEFTPQALYASLQKTRRQLKPLLLDQSFLAGLGNIYADEALHRAGIHPLTPSNRLNPVQAEKLWRSICSVLEDGIRRNGASIDWVYRGGEFQNHFRVYGRAGQPCPVCGAGVQRIVVGQRGTHFCPVCQPPPAKNDE